MPTVKTIIVDKVAEKESKTGNTYLEITDTEGKIHRLFDELIEKFPLAEPGKTLNLTKEQKGKFWNVIDIEVGEAKDVQISETSDDPVKRASIESQQAALFTTQLWIAGKLDEETLEVKALRMWLSSKLGGNPTPQSAEAKKETAKPKVSEPTKGKTSDEIIPADTPNLGAVFSHCFRFWNKQPPETVKELGYNSTSEITESPWECWLRAKDAFETKMPKSDDFESLGG